MSSQHDNVWRLIGGYRGAAIAHALASTGIANVLFEGPQMADDVAHKLELDPVRTLQVLRCAAAFDLMKHQPNGSFELTPAGQTLSDHAKGSLAGPARYFAGTSATAFSRLTDSLAGQDSAFRRAHRMTFYEYLGVHPEVASDYNELIVVDGLGDAIAEAWDFGSAQEVVDVGGGRGQTLADVLRTRPHLSGTLVELRHVVPQADWVFNDDQLKSRMAVLEGDFFEQLPPGGDVYLLCRVLPNWSDEDVIRILSTCRRAMGPGSSLLIVDLEIPERVAAGDFSVIGDLQAMAHFGGRIRSRSELTDLITAAGLTYVGARDVPLDSGLVMVETIRGDA